MKNITADTVMVNKQDKVTITIADKRENKFYAFELTKEEAERLKDAL